MEQTMDLPSLIGKCGFYCGSCPTFIRGNCPGCRLSQRTGSCFTFDCVDRQGVTYCGQCPHFPCDDLFLRKKATVLDREWLKWKKEEKK